MTDPDSRPARQLGSTHVDGPVWVRRTDGGDALIAFFGIIFAILQILYALALLVVQGIIYLVKRVRHGSAKDMESRSPRHRG